MRHVYYACPDYFIAESVEQAREEAAKHHTMCFGPEDAVTSDEWPEDWSDLEPVARRSEGGVMTD